MPPSQRGSSKCPTLAEGFRVRRGAATLLRCSEAIGPAWIFGAITVYLGLA